MTIRMNCFNNKKIALVNNSDKHLDLGFKCDLIKNENININNINKSEILNDYDFILIYDKKQDKKRNEKY